MDRGRSSTALRVGFAGTFAASLVEPVRARLRTACDVTVAGEADTLQHLPDLDVLVTMGFTREMGAAARRLKLVQVPGAGLDRIEQSALPAETCLANVYGHEVGIAEYVIGAMLAWTREFERLDRSLRRGVWESQWAVGAPPPPTWPELAGRTLGILGYGRIGQAVARRARAFDMAILAIRARPANAGGHELEFLGGPEALDQVLRRADYLAVTLSLTEATRGLLGAPQLATMKPSAMLVNVSRAEIVDEDALYEALSRGTIAGAALDVWYCYPAGPGPSFPARRPFHELPNVLMTPHVAGWTQGMLEARATVIAENIDRAARGEAPVNLIPRPR